MTDHLTPEKRSWNMGRIKSKDTKPEKIVRSLLHAMGYRFRLQGKVAKRIYKPGVLPGKPDIVIPKLKTTIFVHGCFWHRHAGCKGCTTPKTRTEWWENKFSKNVARDKKNQQELRSLGWNVIVIWECQVKDLERLQLLLEAYFDSESREFLKVAEERDEYKKPIAKV